MVLVASAPKRERFEISGMFEKHNILDSKLLKTQIAHHAIFRGVEIILQDATNQIPPFAQNCVCVTTGARTRIKCGVTPQPYWPRLNDKEDLLDAHDISPFFWMRILIGSQRFRFENSSDSTLPSNEKRQPLLLTAFDWLSTLSVTATNFRCNRTCES